MKNCTLLRLFFVTIAIPLTLASHSSPSTLKSRTGALTLVDDTNTAQAVPLDPLVPTGEDAPEQRVVPVVDKAVLKQLEVLVSRGEYAEADKLVESMGKDKFMDYLCQAMTTVEQFKGLYEYLKKRDMVSGLLARGSMELVKGVIAEPDLLETNSLGKYNSIYDAVALSLKDDNHARVGDLFEAVKGRCTRDRFEMFVYGFFSEYPPWKDSMPLKRFLTLRGEEFREKHPATFETICERLVRRLKFSLMHSVSQKILQDLVGQLLLLSPAAFAEGFLTGRTSTGRAFVMQYSYREAIQEALKEQYARGGILLWKVMKEEYPTQFSGPLPSTDEARAAALKDYRPTKQDREEAWARENAPILLAELERRAAHILPTVLWRIVSEYAITWVVVG